MSAVSSGLMAEAISANMERRIYLCIQGKETNFRPDGGSNIR
jgi:hypothetical protein